MGHERLSPEFGAMKVYATFQSIREAVNRFFGEVVQLVKPM